MYETFEHTADLGLRIRANDLQGLFSEAGRALFSVMVANFDDIRPLEKMTFRIEGDQRDELLRDWLAELLYAFHGERMLLARFDVQLQPAGLQATAWGEPIDTDRHEIDAELKAITYHGLKVERDDQGNWLAEVIVDT